MANLVRSGAAVRARLVSRELPVPAAVPASPSLEDAYLLLMREAGAALPAAA